MKLNAWELKRLLFEKLGVPGAAVRTRSKYYQLPTKDWVTSQFAPAFREWLSKLSIRYDSGVWDCGSYSLFALTLARLFHLRSDHEDGAGIALGEFSYPRLETDGHSLNLWVVKEGNEAVPLFWEPQNQNWVNLKPEEIIGCNGSLW